MAQVDHIYDTGDAKLTRIQRWVVSRAEKISEAHQIPLGGYGGADDYSEADAHLYRNLSSKAIDESLQPIDQDRLIKAAVFLWQSNPLVWSAIDMIKDYVIALGFIIRARTGNEKTQTVIDQHWDDPDNLWGIDQGSRFRDLMLFGELVPVMFPDKYTGHTKVGILHPLLIESITHDPRNIAFTRQIVCKQDAGGKQKAFWIVKLDQDGKYGKEIGGRYKGIDTTGRLIGDAFYFSMNRLLSATRGRSSLLSAADWIAQHDDLTFMLSENAKVAGAFMWDVLLKGYKKDAIKKFVDRLPTQIKPGTIRAHNEKITWTAVSPDINAADTKEQDRLLMKMILAAFRLPEHWLTGQGADINRASALAMGDPTFMYLRSLQTYYSFAIRSIMQYHIDHVDMFSEANRLPEEPEEKEFDVLNPPIAVDDPDKAADTLDKVTRSATVAEANEWIEPRDAARLFVTQAKRMGVEVDISEKMKEEAKAKIKK